MTKSVCPTRTPRQYDRMGGIMGGGINKTWSHCSENLAIYVNMLLSRGKEKDVK